MNHQQTQRGLNEEVVVSVKALKLAILQAQRAVVTDANRVMLMLYLSIGQFVSQKSRNGVWGTGTIDAISEQLQREMPGLRGFGARNIRNMRFFYEQWRTLLIWQPLAAKLESDNKEVSSLIWQPLAAKLETCCKANSSSILPSTTGESLTIPSILVAWSIQSSDVIELRPEEFFGISFTHHLEILSKTEALEERLFYIRETIANRWNKLTLRTQLAADIYHHARRMPSNFQKAIPETQQAMKALGMFRDEYLLDFINTEELDITNPEDIDEPVIEHAIVAHIRQFIMTFGRDFSFISNQYRLDVAGHELFIDLLFFNRELNCLVAVELKKGEFKPAYLGQLNLYLQALDDQVRKSHENPSIGIILCRSSDKSFVEYAVRDFQKPMGVATYRTADEMPEPLRKALPDIEELKRQLNNTGDDGLF